MTDRGPVPAPPPYDPDRSLIRYREGRQRRGDGSRRKAERKRIGNVIRRMNLLERINELGYTGDDAIAVLHLVETGEYPIAVAGRG